MQQVNDLMNTIIKGYAKIQIFFWNYPPRLLALSKKSQWNITSAAFTYESDQATVKQLTQNNIDH